MESDRSLKSRKLVSLSEKVVCNGYLYNSSAYYQVPCNFPEFKIFCDPVHGHIGLHPACVCIIDTPQFQRLRHIKQLGLLEYVYPGATHNRFEHSLGVAYLARKFLQELKNRQPELSITDQDILCVEIAGLCHDLGHGPFSHVWENFMREASLQRGIKLMWKHEHVSANILDYLIEENDLMTELNKYGIGFAEVKFVKQLIMGEQHMCSEKAFLFQVVNNDDSGLDVDKWDYFLRDCLYLGLPCNFNYQRLIQFARILDVDGRKQICFRDKVVEAVYNMFRTRSSLHRLAYQHKINRIIERMFCDSLLKADGKITGPNGKVLQLWEWSRDTISSQGQQLFCALEKFCMLTDSLVFSCLRFCGNPEIDDAVSLIQAIEKRSCNGHGFYKHIAMKMLPFRCDKTAVLEGMARHLPSTNREVMEIFSNNLAYDIETNVPVDIKDIIIDVTSIHWGKKEKNPVEFVHFYSKCNSSVTNSEIIDESSDLMPKSFEEIQLHILCRRSDAYANQVVGKCFEKYWQCSQIKTSHL